MLKAIAAIAALVLCAAAGPADEQMPPQCNLDPSGRVDWQACANATAPGSDIRRLALINLGTDAAMRQDYASAVRYYDEARPPSGQRLYSDPSFHAFRGDAYLHVGRLPEALEDARTAYAMLAHPETLPAGWRAENASNPVDADVVFALIIPILKRGQDVNYAAALETYRKLPVDDWSVLARRAGVFEQIGENDLAVQTSTQVLAMQPDDPGVLNNHCVILAETGHAQDALQYCEHALRLVPNIAAVHDSYAEALANAGRCAESEREEATAHRLDAVSVEYQQNHACTPGQVAPPSAATSAATH